MSVSAISPISAAPPVSAQPAAAAAPAAATASTASTAASVLYSAQVQIIDPSTGVVVTETRNVDTGVITSQSPSIAALQYERAQMLAAAKAATKGHQVKAA